MAPLGHNYEAVVTAPTCTERGYTTYTCANCGDRYVDTFTDPTGHVSTHVENAKEATCVSDGYTGDTVCDACGAIIEPGLVIPATGEHEYGDWVIIRQPTTEETGLREHTCKLCGHTEQEVMTPIAATPGDANGDGKVNARDARLILRYAASLITGDEIDQAAADFNGDGKVNARDARAILRTAAGLD